MYCRTGLKSGFAEVIASLLQVNRQILHTPYVQVCRDFSGDFCLHRTCKIRPQSLLDQLLWWRGLDTLLLHGSAQTKIPH